jgi:hypothetical protein
MTGAHLVFFAALFGLVAGTALTAAVSEYLHRRPRVYRHSGSRCGLNYNDVD